MALSVPKLCFSPCRSRGQGPVPVSFTVIMYSRLDAGCLRAMNPVALKTHA